MTKPSTKLPDDAEMPHLDRPEDERKGDDRSAIDQVALGGVLSGPVRKRHRSERDEQDAEQVTGVVIGRIVAYSDADGARIAYAPRSETVVFTPRTTTAISPDDVGREVALLFEGGDSTRPIIMGFMQQRSGRDIGVEAKQGTGLVSIELTDDGKRLNLTAQEEVTLRCGDASITLTKAGKILLKGKFLSSHSSGVNRVRGGSVQLN
jgi:hypothetical protein